MRVREACKRQAEERLKGKGKLAVVCKEELAREMGTWIEAKAIKGRRKSQFHSEQLHRLVGLGEERWDVWVRVESHNGSLVV